MENLEQIDTEEYDEEDIDDTSQAINTILEDNNNIDTETHISLPIMTKYEWVMIKIERIEQITNGTIPLIQNADNYDSDNYLLGLHTALFHFLETLDHSSDLFLIVI